MEIGVREASEILQVTEKTVYRWISARKVPYFKVGGQYRFSRSRLMEWVRTEGNLSPEPPEEPSESSPLSGLAACVERGGIFYRVGGGTVQEVLDEAAGLIPLPRSNSAETLLPLLLAREALCSTAIGGGFAIPHPREPEALGLEAPQLSVFFLERPVDFGGLDGQPVHTLFLPLAPRLGGHLHLLARLTLFLADATRAAHFGRKPGIRRNLLHVLEAFDHQTGVTHHESAEIHL